MAFLRISVHMKRINPKTNDIFKYGDVREDGYVFVDYRKTRPIKSDGTYQENWLSPEKFEAQKTYKEKHRKNYKVINKNLVLHKQRLFYAKNRETQLTRIKAWRKANPHKVNAITAKRRAAKLLRTPKWLTADDLFIIEEAYHLAKLRTETLGIPHHVDHILPLQGKKVSGLHVPANLQVIPAKENLQKSNKH